MAKFGWIFWVALSAVLTYLGSPPSRWGGIMLVGLVPLFVAFETAPNWKAAAFRGWVYALLFHTAVAWWSAGAVQEFTHWPGFVGYLVVFALSAFEHAYWALIAALRHVLHKKYGIRPLFWTPIAFMALDAAWPKFFPSTIGNELYSMRVLKQAADLTGAWGLTGLLVAVNEIGAALLTRDWPRKQLRRHTFAVLMLLAAVVAYSSWRYQQIAAQIARPERTIRMALIQPNIPSASKVLAETGSYQQAVSIVLKRSFSMSEKALLQAPQLVVWPETAFPGYYHSQAPVFEDPQMTQVLDDFVNQLPVPLLTGGYDGVGEDHFNSAFLISPGGPRIQRYHKNHLFGPAEKIPFVQGLPGVSAWLRARGHGAFSEGDGPGLFDFEGFKLGPVICGEALYPRFVRKIVDLGAQVIVNLTNDSWFGGGRESEIHLQVMAFRSIETRRPIVRDTNTGHSVVIDIDGSFRGETPLNEARIAVVQVPVYPASLRSPYMIWGDSWLVLGGVWAAWIWLRAFRRFRRASG